MTTPLILAAPHLLEKTISYYFYPHLITFDATKKRWKFNQPKNNCKPSFLLFCYVNIFHILVFTCGCLLLQILKFCVFKHKHVHGALIVVFGGLVFMSIFGWGYNIPAMKYGHYMVEYINALLDFEERINIKRKLFRKYSKFSAMSLEELTMFQSKLF